LSKAAEQPVKLHPQENLMNDNTIHTAVRQHYAEIATQGGGCCAPQAAPASSACCGPTDVNVLLDDINLAQPGELGLGCGFPLRHAGLQPGETVVDLGSGAGADVFRAAPLVGPQGRVIGVDMTPEMVARARATAAEIGAANVEFRLGEIEHLPVETGAVDVVISNCVLNLVPDKRRAFAELFRVLRPGGRFAISDMVTYGPVPAALREDMTEWAGCVAGATDEEEYLGIARAAGFVDLHMPVREEYDYLKGADYGLASITLTAHKP
jgi:SAM-dependent methyltransferase